MTETMVTASHFRVHFKDIANAVARGEEACTVARHGLAIGVLVSVEDAMFLREHKWRKSAGKPKPKPEDTITLIHPDLMPLELVKEAYDLTEGTTDFEIEAWRSKAHFSISARTPRQPATAEPDRPASGAGDEPSQRRSDPASVSEKESDEEPGAPRLGVDLDGDERSVAAASDTS